MHHRRPARTGRRADGRLADFLVGLALRCVLVDALPAFVSLGLPDVLVSLVLALVPFMRNAFTHEHDEHLCVYRKPHPMRLSSLDHAGLLGEG